MPEGFDYKVFTEPFKKGVTDMVGRVDDATKVAVQDGAKKIRAEAKKRTPVYQGKATFGPGGRVMRVSDIKKARRAGRVDRGGTGLVFGETKSTIIKGLLRDSISAGRVVRGRDGEYSLKVGPRGPRAHLYAAKIEDQAHYMHEAYDEVTPQMPKIAADAWSKALGK